MWLADTIFTLMFIQKYGIEAEANPLLRYVIEIGGMKDQSYEKAPLPRHRRPGSGPASLLHVREPRTPVSGNYTCEYGGIGRHPRFRF